MIKFETINGQLCRMVEPTPLTPEATFPCMVRLIQDDSPMGRYNKWNYDGLDELDRCSIVCDATKESEDEEKIFCYEIIGYPVVDGSAEWALYSSINGKSFIHKDAKQCRIFTMFSEGELRVYDGEGETVEYVEIDKFLSYAAKDGWQIYPEPKEEKESPIDPVEIPLRKLILQAMEEGKNIRTFYQDMVFTPVALTELLANGRFRWWNISNWELTTREQNYYLSISTSSDEPKPLLADAKVGWLCKRRDGKWVQIENIAVSTYPILCSDRLNARRYDGHAFDSKESELDIIYAEPLAPEGSAEWAWQMWCLLEKEIAPVNFTAKTYRELNPKKPRITCFYAHDVNYWKAHKDEWLYYAESTQWQLYEPKPCAVCKGTGKVYSCTKKSGKVEDEAGSYALSFTYDAVDCPACKEKEIDKPEHKPEHPAINGYNKYDYVPVEGIKQPKPEPIVSCIKCDNKDKCPHYDDKLDHCIDFTTKPEPKVQVGHPEHPFKNGMYLKTLGDNACWKIVDSSVPNMVETICLSNGQVEWWLPNQIGNVFKILSPAKVVVTIGCLSGTVCKCDDVGMEDTHFYLHIPGTEDDKNAATWCLISFAMLKPAAAAMVRGLIEKQQGDAK